MNTPKILVLVVLVAAIVSGILYLNSQKAPRDVISERVGVKTAMDKEEKIWLYAAAKEITTPDGFINTDGKSVTIGEFVGKKVILVDFWTYSCINCQRTTPYLNAWYERYSASGGSASGGKDKGLIIIGLHTPEFEFEKNYQNVLEATKRMEIKYPVVLDNDYSTWNAYQNRFWPRKYLIDIDGFIVYDHIGEGGYEETEMKIQELLSERSLRLGAAGESAEPLAKPADVPEVDFVHVRSPEIYFGSMRNERLGNGTPHAEGLQDFAEPGLSNANALYLVGAWNIRPEFAANESAGAKIIFRYQAKNVYLVAGSKRALKIKVVRDGKLLGSASGKDASSDGTVSLLENRLYHLIEGEAYSTHTLEIFIEGTGLEAFTFTFG